MTGCGLEMVTDPPSPQHGMCIAYPLDSGGEDVIANSYKVKQHEPPGGRRRVPGDDAGETMQLRSVGEKCHQTTGAE